MSVDRLDHVVLAVANLRRGIETFQRLGFSVVPGGSHGSAGTHNALIRLEDNYLELIAVEDPAKARSTKRGIFICDYLADRTGGMIGLAFETSDPAADREALLASGLTVPDPIRMERLRPDGVLLTWQLLIPDAVAWRRPWPFLIRWDTPEPVRNTRDPAARHRNKARRVAGVTVRVPGEDWARRVYGKGLGMNLAAAGSGPAPAHLTADVGGVTVTLVAADGTSADVDEGAFGLHSVTIEVDSMAGLADELNAVGVDCNWTASGTLAVNPESASGCFVEFGMFRLS